MPGSRPAYASALRPVSGLCTLLSLAVVAGASLCYGEAKALVQVTTRAALGGTDFVDWSTLGFQGDLVPKPFSLNTNLGTAVTGTMEAAGPFELLDQNQSSPWEGNFTIGDHLLFTNTFGDSINPISLLFPTGFAGVGTQIQSDASGAFTARVSAYAAGDELLGSYDFIGESTAPPNPPTPTVPGTAIFVGVRTYDTAKPIVRVDFSIQSAANNVSSFAINQVDFTSSFDPPIDAVPAPLPFLGVAAGFGYSRRLKARIKASRQL